MQNDRKSDDVLVIGGGVIGLACAHYLRDAGRAVRVIEQGSVGAGASHGNCGLVFTSDLVPLCVPGAVRQEILGMLRRTSPLSIAPTLDMGRIFWLFKFAGMCRAGHVRHAIRARAAILKSSGQLFETLLGPGGLAAEYERRGVLLVYRSEAAMDGYGAVNDLLRPHGVAAEALVGNALLGVEPALREDVYGAWYHRGDSHLRPDKLLASWKQALARSGVVIEEDCRLERFRCAAGRIEAAVTNRGEHAARDFVLAAGAWSAPISAQLGLKLPLQPGKGYSITMDRPAVCPQIPCYFYERRVVATPWPSGFRLGGTMQFAGFDTQLSAYRLRNLKTAAREYLKAPMGQAVIEEWAGLRPMTYDELPVIDRAGRFQNLFVATGHGMLGVTAAPATGKLVAELICGKLPHIDPAPFSVRRFG